MSVIPRIPGMHFTVDIPPEAQPQDRWAAEAGPRLCSTTPADGEMQLVSSRVRRGCFLGLDPEVNHAEMVRRTVQIM
jgi:hypothetical protein